METKYTEEQLQQTNVAKGFAAFTYISDLMKRYPFDLRVNRGGRIFVDSTTNMKLRRKVIKGDSEQNHTFEAYQTRDGNNVVQATVEIRDEAFTPSMLIAGVAAKLANDPDDSTSTRIAIMMLQGASALLQEAQKENKVVQNLAGQMHPEVADEFYRNIQDVQTRAYASVMISDLAQYAIGSNPNLVSLEDSLDFLTKVDDDKYGQGAKEEAMNTINLIHAGLTTLGFSQVFQDVQVMCDEIKNSVGDAAMVELSNSPQL